MIRWEQVRKALIEFFFPAFCLGCGEEGGLLCSFCIASIKKVQPPFCRRCGIPLKLPIPTDICLSCAKRPLSIDGIRSPFLYTGVIRQAIHSLKYNRIKALAPILAKLLADYLAFHPLLGNTLIPVPLHSKRLRERGFNQASLLAIELSKLINLPVEEGVLIRTRNTAPQVSLDAVQRKENVEGAFKCSSQGFKGKRVILLDDVCTTGSTLDACAKALKEAGALTVWGLTLAREA